MLSLCFMPLLRSLLSVCLPALINQTQGNVMMSPRPTGRARQPVTQISICEVSEVSLSQIKKSHKHEDFFFSFYKGFLFVLPPAFQVGSGKPLDKLIEMCLLCGQSSELLLN